MPADVRVRVSTRAELSRSLPQRVAIGKLPGEYLRSCQLPVNELTGA